MGDDIKGHGNLPCYFLSVEGRHCERWWVLQSRVVMQSGGSFFVQLDHTICFAACVQD